VAMQTFVTISVLSLNSVFDISEYFDFYLKTGKSEGSIVQQVTGNR
jgi:hypothetical protein